MYLKSLELNGFKSFGKKAILEFNCPITSIVGPNGSGKSNIAEAFRFVLGEQSIKSMRGKKGEDLIFNGSADAGRANRAGVKIVFDNSKRLLNIDFDEVALERVVFRDGINEYYINGSKVRLKDISELLAGAHIGSSGHHIISQGEADRILHSNPKERREMIEDALGIKIYQYKKEESEKKLEKTADNMKQIESLRREIAPHLRFLKKQVEKLEKAEEIKKELLALGKEYFKKEEIYIEGEKRRIKNERQAPEAEIRELEEKLSQAKKMVEQSSGEDEKTPEIINIERRLQEVRSEKDSLTRELGKIEGEISYLRRAIEKEEHSIAEEGSKLIKLSLVEDMKDRISEEVMIAESTGTIEAFKSAILKIKSFFANFVQEHKIAHSSDVIDSLKIEYSSLQSGKNSVEEKLSSAKSIEIKELANYESTRKEMERVKDDTREAEKEIFRIVARQNELHNVIDRIKMSERDLMYVEQAFKSDIQEISAIIGIEVLRFEDSSSGEMSEDRSLQKEKKNHLERLKIRLEEMGISAGDDVMKEYKETEERDIFLAKELIDLGTASEDLKKLIAELEERLNVEFRDGVKKINEEFGKYFSMMFGGGFASLKLIKPERKRRGEDEESAEISAEILADKEEQEGIDIEVSLPHKKIKGLMMLSGGERALTSIALLFAISQVNPPPFVILDETDAALDEANSRKYGDMVEALSKHSQLIVITHNRETMSRAGILYGITMGKDAVSKLLSIQFEEAVEVAK